ncbi:zinc fingers and homeoboxes protein 3-like [Coregonus clupeaformis]|uniref:zinc fingers and homeoboxes protein 3-like n=1 Tax=Coregonus clupeaformis TaxID=59861 RepID=UPI001E1C8D71|nr:zinc fingers and homeoboxes protein 3-like [Coregonus clupeaformis]
MASKRKSTTPCMIPNKTMHLREELEQDAYLSDPPSLRQAQARDQGYPMGGNRQSPLERSPGESSRPEGGGIVKDWGGTYMCRHCNFETQDLNLFLDHVYSGHPDFRADPSFQCVDCGVSAAKFEGLALHNARVHLSTVSTTLQLRKRDMRLVVEQSLVTGTETARDTEISITKTPIMRMLKGKSESKRIVVSHSSHDEPSSDPPPLFISTSKDTERKETPTVTVTHVPTIMHNGTATKVTLPSAIQIVNGSGALPMLKTAITQVVSVIQNRNFHHQTAPITVSSALSSTTSYSTSSKNMPKVMIPLSSIPTYSASMDSSSFLKTSFSKFPYPTKAELCYLTVVTKFPEEQIKIWFTAQRLKQGISWSPEEIEEARRKMFNTIIQTAPPSTQHHTLHRGQTQAQHTITVLPASLGSTGIPHILQGSLVGQGGVIVTQPMMANGIQVSNAPMALAVTPKHQAAARPMVQARPAAALVADKGISMVGTVGSSSSGSNISSSNGGESTSSISSGSSSFSSHASVINFSLGNNQGNSIHSNINGKAINTNGKAINGNGKIYNAIANLNGKSNSNAISMVKSINTDSRRNDGSKSHSSTIAKIISESSVISDIKSTIDNKPNSSNDTNSSSSLSNKKTITTPTCGPTATPPPTASTNTTSNPTTTKTEAASSPSTKHSSSSSPAPSGSTDASGTPISRTLPNTFLDPSFYKSKKSVEQLCALKESFTNNQFPNQEEVDRLISITGLTVREVRKWFSDRRYHFRNLKGGRSSTGGQGGASTPTTPGLASATTRSGTPSGTPMDLSDTATPNEPPQKKQQGSAALSAPPSQMPTSPTTLSRRPPRPPSPDFTAIRYKERDPQQVRALEASFSQDPDPSGEEVDRLRSETKMTRREIHGWFAERRKRVAAEKKKEELEREEEEEMDAGGREVGGKSKDDAGVKKEEDAEERQKEDGSGSELKVNPIKINLKMLKVTESNGKLETEGGQANSPTMPTLFPPAPTLTPAPSTIPSLTPKPSPSPKPSPIRGKKTLEQLHLLKQVFARTQWPSAVQYDELISSTGLPRPEVVRWFGDCRYVQKNSQLKWLEAYQTMVLEEDFQRGDTQMLKAHLEAHGSLEEEQVLELAQASGLTEELVRRWFSTQAPLLLQGKDRGVAEEVEAGETPGVGGVTVTASPAPTAPMEGGAAEPVQGEGEVKEEKMEQSVCGGTKEGDEERSAENKAVNPGKGTD